MSIQIPTSVGVLCTLLLTAFAHDAIAAPQVGEVVFVRGVATAQVRGAAARVLAPGAAIEEGDVITTASRSYAVLSMADGTKMTLREGTAFEIEEFRYRDEQSAVMRLFKGGLRAITGFISKRNPDGYRVRTSLASIGIRGTEFEARLCAADCETEAARVRRAAESARSPVVARAVFLRGRVQARLGGGGSRALSLGGALYEGDLVETGTGSIGVIAFSDGTRVTLKAQTTFVIERMRFAEDLPEEDGMLARLVRGGLRAVTGLMGRRNRERVSFRTGTASIGIRGTGIDLACEGECGEPSPSADVAPDLLLDPIRRLLDAVMRTASAQGPRIFVLFWQGSGSLTTPGGSVELATNQIGLVAGGEAPRLFAGPLPPVLDALQGEAPRPDGDDSVDPTLRDRLDQLFDQREVEAPEAGTLVVLVEDGDVEVSNARGDVVHLGRGEGSVTSGVLGAPVRVAASAVRIIRLPSPALFTEGSDLLRDLGASFDLELRDDGQMCLKL